MATAQSLWLSSLPMASMLGFVPRRTAGATGGLLGVVRAAESHYPRRTLACLMEVHKRSFAKNFTPNRARWLAGGCRTGHVRQGHGYKSPYAGNACGRIKRVDRFLVGIRISFDLRRAIDDTVMGLCVAARGREHSLFLLSLARPINCPRDDVPTCRDGIPAMRCCLRLAGIASRRSSRRAFSRLQDGGASGRLHIGLGWLT